MPRNASGTYSLPSGNPVESGTLIEANWANTTLNDIANEITDSLSRSGEGGMLAPFRLADGLQATPGIAWLNEPSTGFYRAGSGEMWGVVGGTQVLQYTANGVLIPVSRTLTNNGNTTLGGTLAVTGTSTLTGALTANGGVGTTTLSTSGLATLNSASVTGNLSVGGTLTLTGGLTLNGNVVVGDSSADTLTINSTVTSNLIFTDNTYDIGASGATRPRHLYVAGNGVFGGTMAVTGTSTFTGALTASGGVVGNLTGNVTGSISGGTVAGTTGAFSSNVTVGGTLGVTGVTTLTVNPVLSAGTANGVLYLNGSKEATSGSALTFNGSTLDVTGSVTADGLTVNSGTTNTTATFESTDQYAFVNFKDNTSTDGTFIGAEGNNFIVQSDSSKRLLTAALGGDISFYEDTGTSAKFFWDASAEALGIGTTSPSGNLEIATSAADTGVDLVLDGNKTSNGGIGSIIFNNNGDSVGMIRSNRASANDAADMLFYTQATGGANTERMRIGSTGLVGIGTSAPEVPLHVKNSSAGTAVIIESSDAGTADGPTLNLWRNSASPVSGDGVGSIIFQGENDTGGRKTFAQIRAEASDVTSTSEDGLLNIRTTINGSDVTRINLSLTEAVFNESGADLDFRVESDTQTHALFVQGSDGNVGIGTSSPGSYRLNVQGGSSSFTYNAANQTAGEFYNNSATGYGLYVQGGGAGSRYALNVLDYAGTSILYAGNNNNVGLGTSSPAYKLDITSASDADLLQIKSTASANNTVLRLGISGNDGVINASGGSTGALAIKTYGTERLRIDSSGNLGLGVTPSAWSSPDFRGLQVGSGISLYGRGSGDADRGGLSANAFNDGAWKYIATGNATNYVQSDGSHAWYTAPSGTAGTAISFTQAMTLNASGNLLVGKTSSTGVASQNIEVSNSSSSSVAIKGGSNEWSMLVSSASDSLRFYEDSTERARITSAGEFLVGQTGGSVNTVGAYITGGGQGAFCTSGDTNILVNRKASDGTLISFRQDDNEEGTISVSGATVSYNAFAGSHWSQLQDGSKPDILRGTVMESINELCVWPGEQNERLPKAKISDTAGSKKVYGVFMAWDNDWTETNDMYVTAVGAFICRVNGSVTVQEGDLLESNGDGTARVQADDIIRSSTIGKVTSTVKTHEYDDGSYCVPTVLYCG